MFTGIATNIGTIKDINEINSEYLIETDMKTSDVKIGSSVLCSGICLTVIKINKNSFTTNISEETLIATNAKYWKKGTRLNLEKSLKLQDELGGHIVTGHIDQITKVIEKKILEKSMLLNIYLPAKLKKFICRKGSIAIDGISLTINKVNTKNFFVNLIPHTASITTLGDLEKGHKVNLEVDVLARYIDNNMNFRK